MPCEIESNHACVWRHHKCHSSSSRDFAPPKTKNGYAPDLVLEPVHIVASLNVDVLNKQLNAEITTTVRANNVGRTIKFNGVGFQNVAVTLVDASSQFQWRYDGEHITVTFDEALQPGEEKKVKIAYLVEKPIAGLLFSTPDEKYPNRDTFAATDHETEKARYWLACIDYPTIKTSIEWIITANKRFTIVANGLLVSETVNSDETKTAIWKLEQICPSYLLCFAVGDFVYVDDGDVHGIPLRYYATKSIPVEDLKRSFGNTATIMNWLEKKLGNPFPYPKYYQIAFHRQGGAMENISLTTWDPIFVCDETWAKEWLRETELTNVHEMAHSYHGDLLTIRHFEHAWLKESWATYLEMCWLEDMRNFDEFCYEMFSARERYFGECEEYVRPIVSKQYETSWEMFDRHLYPGGGWRIHMLRKLMGDTVFWKAIKEYIEVFSFKAVETEDFRKILEKNSKLNLTRFFDQWFYSPGYPKIKGTFEHDAEKKEATLILEQTQEDEKTHVKLFDIQLDVLVKDDQGKEYTKTVKFEGNRGVAMFALNGKPTEVRIDPDMKVLFSLELNPGEDLLNNTLLHGNNIFQRVWAATELIKIGTLSSLKKVSEAMKTEKFYAARSLTAKKLSEAKSFYATQILAEILQREDNALALSDISSYCTHIKDDSIKQAVLTILGRDHSTLPYRALANSLEALGYQRDPAHLPLLKAKLTGESYLGFVRAGALKGLAHYRNVDVLEIIKSLIDYGADSEDVRKRIFEAYAQLVTLLDIPTIEGIKKEAVEKLEKILMDPDFGSQSATHAAIRALAKLESKSSIEAIEGAKRRLPAQDYPEVDREIKAISESGEKPNAQLKKDLEDLMERMKKLEHKLQDEEAKKEK